MYTQANSHILQLALCGGGGCCRAASVSKRSKANDRSLFEILLYLYDYVYVHIQYLCAVTLLLYTLLCVCLLYQLCILFTVHRKYTLMWLPFLLQTPSGLPVWSIQLPRSGLYLHTLTNHSLSSGQPWRAVGVCSSGLPLCGPQDVQIRCCLQVHFQVYCI